ncbi:hypothetical protein BC833DRAFT_71348 [Globomyces pollinis-pini]|nr:hypothetical protein BC833DRAFT_71348 [Globomyces pollinis-pini]
MSSTRPIKNNNHYHADYQPYSGILKHTLMTDKRYNTPKNDDTRYKDVKQRRYDDSKKYDDNRFDHEPLQKRRFDDESPFSQQKRISIEPRRFEDRRVIEKDRQLDVLDRQISNPPQVYATNKRHTQSNSKELPMTKVGVTVSRFPVYKNTNMYEMGSQVGEGTYG